MLMGVSHPDVWLYPWLNFFQPIYIQEQSDADYIRTVHMYICSMHASLQIYICTAAIVV